MSTHCNLIANTLACRLALWHVAGLGPIKYQRLLDHFNNCHEVFDASSTVLRQLALSESIIKQIKQPDWAIVEADLIWQQQAQQHIICWQDDDYPQLLKETAAAPPILFVRGNPKALNKPQLAMVGSRNPTPNGYDNADYFATQLAQASFIITSGLAIGIDTASHRAALNCDGQTIAVLGTGIDRIYPSRNRELAAQIIENGAIISEFPRTTQPTAKNFPRRNRLVSGLSFGVLVVEAALKSGSLITANYANEQNREVFAIPGSIQNPLARGCHSLIKNGAKLVETAADIFEEFGLTNEASSSPQRSTHNDAKLNREQQQIIDNMAYESCSMDTLLRRTRLSSAILSRQLLDLELKGIIISGPGGYSRK